MQIKTTILGLTLLILLQASVHSAPLQIIDTDIPAGSSHDHDLIQIHYGGPKYSDPDQEPLTLPLFAPIILENYRSDPRLELIGDETVVSTSTTSTSTETITETDWTSSPSTTETESESTTTPGMAQGTTFNIDDTDEDNEMPLHHFREKRNRHKIRHNFMNNRYANSYK